MNTNYDHCDQILSTQEVWSVVSLRTRLLCVLTPKNGNLLIAVESYVLVSIYGKGSHSNTGGCGGRGGHPQYSFLREWGQYLRKRNATLCKVFLIKY